MSFLHGCLCPWQYDQLAALASSFLTVAQIKVCDCLLSKQLLICLLSAVHVTYEL